MSDHVDVVIVGAGISGLCSACLLKKHGLRVAVLEARDRVGGRTFTVNHPKHGSIDVGGAYVGPTQNRVYRLIKQFGLQVYNLDESKKSVLKICGSWSAAKANNLPLNMLSILDLNNIMRTLDRMAREVPLDAPWNAAKAKEWDSMTALELINSLCWTKEIKSLMTTLVNAVYACEPHELSVLFFLTYIHSCHGMARMSSITNGAQEKKIVGGTQQLSTKMAESLGAAVHLNSPVNSICQDARGVEVKTVQGRTFKCQYVISAVPLPLLSKIHFSPPFPTLRTQLIQRVPMGSVIKAVTFYQTAFWKDLDMSGMAVTDTGPSVACMDDTKPDGSHPAIMSFILADQSRGLASLSVEERKLKLCEHLAETFRCKKFLEPIDYVEKNWMEEEYSGGCYTVYMPPGVLTQYGSEMRKPFERVYFAGTETATKWRGYMDGAIQAGERAAREVLHTLGKIPKSEISQEEPESVEYPAPPIPVSWIEQAMPSVPVFFAGVTIVISVVLGIVLSHLCLMD